MWKIHQRSEQNKLLDGLLVTFAVLFENEIRLKKTWSVRLGLLFSPNKSTLYCQIEIKSKMFCTDISKKIYLRFKQRQSHDSDKVMYINSNLAYKNLFFWSTHQNWILLLNLVITFPTKAGVKHHKGHSSFQSYLCMIFSNLGVHSFTKLALFFNRFIFLIME